MSFFFGGDVGSDKKICSSGFFVVVGGGSGTNDLKGFEMLQ